MLTPIITSDGASYDRYNVELAPAVLIENFTNTYYAIEDSAGGLLDVVPPGYSAQIVLPTSTQYIQVKAATQGKLPQKVFASPVLYADTLAVSPGNNIQTPLLNGLIASTLSATISGSVTIDTSGGPVDFSGDVTNPILSTSKTKIYTTTLSIPALSGSAIVYTVNLPLIAAPQALLVRTATLYIVSSLSNSYSYSGNISAQVVTNTATFDAVANNTLDPAVNSYDNTVNLPYAFAFADAVECNNLQITVQQLSGGTPANPQVADDITIIYVPDGQVLPSWDEYSRQPSFTGINENTPVSSASYQTPFPVEIVDAQVRQQDLSYGPGPSSVEIAVPNASMLWVRGEIYFLLSNSGTSTASVDVFIGTSGNHVSQVLILDVAAGASNQPYYFTVGFPLQTNTQSGSIPVYTIPPTNNIQFYTGSSNITGSYSYNLAYD